MFVYTIKDILGVCFLTVAIIALVYSWLSEQIKNWIKKRKK